MNILSLLLALEVAWDFFLPCILPFYVRSFGPAAGVELGRLIPAVELFGVLLWSVLFALNKSQQLFDECWPIVLGALYHRFAPDRACPNWNCPRCWDTRGVVLGPSILSDRGLL